jgi:hypothetical protein
MVAPRHSLMSQKITTTAAAQLLSHPLNLTMVTTAVAKFQYSLIISSLQYRMLVPSLKSQLNQL